MTTIGEETLLRQTNLFEPHPRTGGDSDAQVACTLRSKTARVQQLGQIGRRWNETHGRLENAKDRYYEVLWIEICTKDQDILEAKHQVHRASTLVPIASKVTRTYLTTSTPRVEQDTRGPPR